jgi:hypothetical protein
LVALVSEDTTIEMAVFRGCRAQMNPITENTQELDTPVEDIDALN